MNRTLQLQQDKRDAAVKAGAILTKLEAEKRTSMTPEERADYDAHIAKGKEIDALLVDHENLASLEASSGNAHTDRGATGAATVQVHDRWTDNPTLFGREAVAGETKDQRKARIFHGFGEQLAAVKEATLIQQSAISGKQVDKRLFELQERAAAAGASEQIPADGGFLVAPEFSNEILQVAHDVGNIYPLVRKLPLSDATNALKVPGIDEQSRVDGSRWGGVRMYWENEADALTASKPKFRMVELVTKKLTGLYYATNEVLSDARILGSLVMEAFGEEMAFKLDDGVFRGTGAGQLLGFMNSAALVTVAKETSQAATTLLFANIVKMRARMWNRSRQNGVWLINQDVEPQLLQMSIAVKNVAGSENVAGWPVYLPPGGASQLPYGTLMGRPVIPVEQCDTLGNLGDIVFADLSQFLMVDKGDMQAAASIHIRFLTDEQTFRWIYRCDGQPIWHSAITPFKGTNTLSPFVALAAR